MIHLFIFIAGIFSLFCTLVIDVIRMVTAATKKGIEIPDDKIEIVRLWYDYFDGKF